MYNVKVKLTVEAFFDTYADWSSLTDDARAEGMRLCGFNLVDGNISLFMTKTNAPVEASRNPFAMVTGATLTPTGSDAPEWLKLGPARDTWVLGDDIDYGGSSIRIRSVNRKMVDYIIDHFESGPKPAGVCKQADNVLIS